MCGTDSIKKAARCGLTEKIQSESATLMRRFKTGFHHLFPQRVCNVTVATGNGVDNVIHHIIKVVLVKLLQRELRAAFIVDGESPFDVVTAVFLP